MNEELGWSISPFDSDSEVMKGFQRGWRGQSMKTALTISGGLSIIISVSKVDDGI